MKNDIVSYELGSFIDFKGNERMVIACAVSQSVNNTDKTQFTANWSNHNSDPILIVRVISIGIAVYNSEDEFNIEQGKTIAYNRALYNNPSIFIAKGGVFNKATTSELLKKAISNFAKNPESIIDGYNEAAEKYAVIQESKNAIKNFTKEERAIIDAYNKGVDTLGVMQKALPYLNALKNKSTLVD